MQRYIGLDFDYRHLHQFLLVNRVGTQALTYLRQTDSSYFDRNPVSAMRAVGDSMPWYTEKSPNAEVAHLAEQLTCNEKVGGSIPLLGTI